MKISTNRLKLRKRRAGDLIVGPWHSSGAADFLLGTGRGSLLIYDISSRGGISTIGVYPEASEPAAICALAPTTEPPFRNACFSSASMENVAIISVYRALDHSCRGVLFEYYDGSKQAVGQCRVGVDSVQNYERPSRLCFLPIVVRRSGTEAFLDATKVDVLSRSAARPGPDWRCCNLKGRLEVWFTGEETRMSAVQ